MSLRTEREQPSEKQSLESLERGYKSARTQMLLCKEGEMTYELVHNYIAAGEEYWRQKMYLGVGDAYVYEEDAQAPAFLERRREFRRWKDASLAMDGEGDTSSVLTLLSREQEKLRKEIKEIKSFERLAELGMTPANGNSYKATVYRRNTEVRALTRAMNVVVSVSTMNSVVAVNEEAPEKELMEERESQ